LPKEIPALIKFDLQGPQPTLILIAVGFTSQHLMLLTDKFIDSLEHRLIGRLLLHFIT
jgi:hypothetical protein